MKHLTEKDLLVALIQDDLINHRLIMGLDKLGLVSEVYYIHASQTVFNYLGIKEKPGEEVHYERYQKMKNKVMRLNLEKHHVKLKKLAEEIYSEVVGMGAGQMLRQAQHDV